MTDLGRTLHLASAAGMTYGAYVAQYGTAATPKPPNGKVVRCAVCGVDISHKHHRAKYCDNCAANKMN